MIAVSEALVPDVHAFQPAADVGVIDQRAAVFIALPGEHDVHAGGERAGDGKGHLHAAVGHGLLHRLQQKTAHAPAAQFRARGKVGHLDLSHLRFHDR